MRARQLRPPFWGGEAVGRVCREARLLLLGLCNLADDEGRFRASTRLIRTALFPYDDDLDDDGVSSWLAELARAGLVVLHDHAVGRIGQLDFRYPSPVEQSVSHPTPSRLPAPPPDQPGLFDAGGAPETAPLRRIPEDSEICRSEDRRSKEEDRRAPPARDRQEAVAILSVFEHWRTVLRHPGAVLTADRRRRIQARLREGRTVEELKEVVDGCAASAFHMGENDEGRVYDSVELLFRNAGKVDTFRDILAGQRGERRRATAPAQPCACGCGLALEPPTRSTNRGMMRAACAEVAR